MVFPMSPRFSLRSFPLRAQQIWLEDLVSAAHYNDIHCSNATYTTDENLIWLTTYHPHMFCSSTRHTRAIQSVSTVLM